MKLKDSLGVGRRILQEIAIDCGALYKINTITLIDMDIFEKYFEENYKVRREDDK